MQKVLLVDDELLVRIGMKTLFPWDENGFKLVGEAKNGSEAIDLFNKHNPDIVITDICMPLMDGFELINRLKKMNNSIKIIILTHHDKFSYAKEALKLGADDYILKSELNCNKLQEVFKNLKSTIKDTDSENLDLDLDIDNKKKEILKEYLFNIHGGNVLDVYNDYFSDNTSFLVAYLKLFSSDNSLRNNNFIHSVIEDTINCQLKYRDYKAFIFYRSEFEVIIIFCIEAKAERGKVYEKCNNILQIIIKNLAQYLNISISSGISSFSKSISNISILLEQSMGLSMKEQIANTNSNFISQDLETSNQYSDAINKSINYVKENYHSPITLDSLANKLHISKSYFSHLFKLEIGINFSLFLTNYRIKRALVLLRDTNYKISEISEQVGFKDIYYFSKVFKQLMGITCKEYRTKFSRENFNI